jgi:archaellum biogenesis ATPase FlaH
MINVEQLSPKSFFKYFKGRPDRVMLYARGKEITQEIKRGEFEIIQRLEAHLAGSTRVGFYNLLNGDVIPWAVVNFTEGGVSNNPAKDSGILSTELQKLGLRGVRRERTMLPKEDYNVWLFFETPISSKKVRHFFFTLFEKLGFSKNIPIIPTTDSLNPGSFGQHVWLPFFNGIDKWLDDEGNLYVCNGIKNQQTVFIDTEEKVIENNIFDIPTSGEGDLDHALTLLTGDVGNKYLPGIGLHIPGSSFTGMLKDCKAFENIINKIDQTGDISMDGLLRLASLLRGTGLDNTFNRYLGKLTNIDAGKFEKNFAAYTGNTFPTCLDMKQIGFCPVEKNCFEKRAPIKEKMGIWTESSGNEKIFEPTSAPWFFKALLECKCEEPEESCSAANMNTIISTNNNTPETSQPPLPQRNQSINISLQPGDKVLHLFEEKLGRLKAEFDPQKKKLSGFSTGFDNLDEVTGGLRKGNLLILTGPPGAGKSTFARQIIDTVTEKEKVPCLYVSYDLSSEELQRKTISRLSGVPVSSILKGDFNGENWEKVIKTIKILKERTGNLLCTLEADEFICVSQIKKSVENTNAQFVVIDHIQAIPDGESPGSDPETQKLILLSKLKSIAKSYDLPILAVSNSSMSRSVQYGSDILLQMQQQVNPQIASSDKQPYAVLLNVEKNREGRSMISLQLSFFPARMMFYGEKPIDYRQIKY